jgi:hypothetical protein
MKLLNPIISKRFFLPTVYPSDFGCGSLLKQMLNVRHQLQIVFWWEWLLYQQHLFHAYVLDLTDIELMEITYTYTFKLCWLGLSAQRKNGTDVLVFGCKAKKT